MPTYAGAADVDIDMHDFKEDMELCKVDMDRFKADMEHFKADIERLQSRVKAIAFEFAQGPKPVPVPKPGAGRGSHRQQRGSQLSERHARARQRPMGRGRSVLHARRQSERHARRRRDVLDRLGAEQAGQRRGRTRVAGADAQDVSGKPLGDRSARARSRNPPVGRPAGAARKTFRTKSCG